ncbi:MAG: hypothetical protein E7057_10415 [Lentisphaerae bacterium]|nr:hypothetical protein [Lentisphaerota bacterium]
MEMLAKYIRMRTARSAATASHPCVEHATEGINQYREQSFSKKNKSIKPRQRSGATIRFLCQAFFLVKESGRFYYSTGFFPDVIHTPARNAGA